MAIVKTGLEVFLSDPPSSITDRRLGLLCNPASVDRRLIHARLRIDQDLPGQLKALYAPQHGFYAEKQDNMIESADRSDPATGLPVFSLYGDTRVPTHAMMAPIDILLVDLQDVGTRVYTFIYTLSHCMEAARQYGKKIIVMDRPNPVGGLRVEGNLLAPDCSSFVGRYPIPMRHGLTIGELAPAVQHPFRHRLRPRSGFHAGVEKRNALRPDRPALGGAVAQSAHTGVDHGLPGPGHLGRHKHL